MFNTLESHRAVAEAVQQMWKKNINIDVELENQEWKVYIDNQRTLNYEVGRYAWIGDYVDPNSFLDMFLSGGGNSQQPVVFLVRPASLVIAPAAEKNVEE